MLGWGSRESVTVSIVQDAVGTLGSAEYDPSRHSEL